MKNYNALKYPVWRDHDVYKSMGSPIFWVLKADSLYRAACVLNAERKRDEMPRLNPNPRPGEPKYVSGLYGKPSLSNPWWFMAAAATENLFKAMMIAHDGDLVTDRIDKKVKEHDLVELSKYAGYALSDDERAFCEVGSAALTIWGRYPIPLHSNTSVGETGVVNPEQMFESFYGKLREQTGVQNPLVM